MVGTVDVTRFDRDPVPEQKCLRHSDRIAKPTSQSLELFDVAPTLTQGRRRPDRVVASEQYFGPGEVVTRLPRQVQRLVAQSLTSYRVAGEDELQSKIRQQPRPEGRVARLDGGEGRLEGGAPLLIDGADHAEQDAPVIGQGGASEPLRIASFVCQPRRPEQRLTVQRVAGAPLSLAQADGRVDATYVIGCGAGGVEHAEGLKVVRDRLVMGELRQGPIAGLRGVGDRFVG